jgi:hypothetical protein
MDAPIGLILRFGDNLLTKNIDTIEEHNKIYEKHGRVYFGKNGKFIGKAAIEICNNEKMIKYLILAKIVAKRHVLHIAEIESAQSVRPSLHLIPKYYRDRAGILSWICLKSLLYPLNEDELTLWSIKSSGSNILTTLRESMASYFIAIKNKVS